MNGIYYEFRNGGRNEVPLRGSRELTPKMNSGRMGRDLRYLCGVSDVEWRWRVVIPGSTFQGIHDSVHISRSAVVREHGVGQHNSAEPGVRVRALDDCVSEFSGAAGCVPRDRKCHIRWHELAKDVIQCSRNI